ncbi:MAG: septum formation initiator family protein [Patescibacteria group bacterium]
MKFSSGQILKSRWLIAVCLVILVFLLVTFGREFYRRYYLEEQIKALAGQVSELENKNQEFNQLINYLQTTNFTEEEARVKLGLKKPGEEVVVINQADGGFATKLTAESGGRWGNPGRWWNYFFGLKS